MQIPGERRMDYFKVKSLISGNNLFHFQILKRYQEAKLIAFIIVIRSRKTILSVSYNYVVRIGERLLLLLQRITKKVLQSLEVLRKYIWKVSTKMLLLKIYFDKTSFPFMREERDMRKVKVAVADMTYFTRSKFLRISVHKKNFSFI